MGNLDLTVHQETQDKTDNKVHWDSQDLWDQWDSLVLRGLGDPRVTVALMVTQEPQVHRVSQAHRGPQAPQEF